MKTLSNLAICWMLSIASMIFFVPLFHTRGIGAFDFWWWLSANLVFLLALSLVLPPSWLSRLHEDAARRRFVKIAGGLLSAALLYGIFTLAGELSRWLLPFADSGIRDIYGFKSYASQLRIFLLMLIFIGPGEELFWRGVLQHHLAKCFSPWQGFLLAGFLYGLVHVGSGNVMLVAAAAVCGFFWGLLYFRFHSLILNIVSHTAWDLAVFLFFPLS